MIILYFLLSLLFWIYIELAVFFLYLLSFPLFFLPSINRSALYFSSRRILRLIFWLCRIGVKVDDRTGSPIQGIVSSTREGLIDPLYILAYFPVQVRFVVDRELFMIPIFALVLSILGCIPAPARRGSFRGFYRRIESALTAGETLFFFPGDKHGPARIAQMTGSKLYKVDLAGGGGVMPMESMILRPGPVTILVKVESKPQN